MNDSSFGTSTEDDGNAAVIIESLFDSGKSISEATVLVTKKGYIQDKFTFAPEYFQALKDERMKLRVVILRRSQ